MKQTITTFITLLVSFSLFSQSPGGVGTANLRGWFDASTGITLVGVGVSAWQDRSTVGNATQTNASERPTVSTATINYNDALRFDGSNDNLDLIDRMSSTVTAVSAYAVARQMGTTGDTWGSIINGQVNGPSWTGGGYGLVALNSGNTLQGFYVRDYNTRGVSFSISNGVTFLTSGTWNGTTANNVQAFRNGISAGTVGYTPGSVGDGGSTWIGSGDGSANNWSFYGDIAEIAVFNTGLSTANNNKVMSYLGIKYGITLGIDYTNSAGTTIYATTGAYTNNIIGVARDDGSGLTQKQSRATDDSVRVYISTLAASNSANAGSFSSNLSHIMIGSNSGKMCVAGTTTAEIPGGFGILRRLDREWKVTNTNFSGTYSIDFRLNACALPASVTAAHLRLLIDDDGNFAAGTNTAIPSGSAGITISYANPVITVSGIPASLLASGSTSYITIGSTNLSTPLPVELLDFYALSNNNHIDLNWETASESNTSHFELERSTDAITFNYLTSMPSKHIDGSGSEIMKYNIKDESPLHGTAYYRLKQYDLDGNFSYSPVIPVSYRRGTETNFVIFPNPSTGDLTLKTLNNISEGEITLEFTDALGHVALSQTLDYTTNQNEIKINTEDKLAPGVYFCTVKNNGNEQTIKVFITKE